MKVYQNFQKQNYIVAASVVVSHVSTVVNVHTSLSDVFVAHNWSLLKYRRDISSIVRFARNLQDKHIIIFINN